MKFFVLNQKKNIFLIPFDAKIETRESTQSSNRRSRQRYESALVASTTATDSGSKPKRKATRQGDSPIAAKESTSDRTHTAKTASSTPATVSNQAETANLKSNKLKRKQQQSSSRALYHHLSHPSSDPIEISSDEESTVQEKTQKNCIASRTRSKAHTPTKSPSKKAKLSTSQASGGGGSATPTLATSFGTDSTATTLGSNIRKTSRHQSGEQSSSNTSSRHKHLTATSSSSSSSTARRTPTTSPLLIDPNAGASSSLASYNSSLRRSSRSKVQQSTVTTGSCVSSAASTSQACSYQIRGSANDTSSTIGSHSSGNNNGNTTTKHKSSSTSNKHQRNNYDTNTTAAHNQFLLGASTSQHGMANDGSRDAHQSQNHYGKLKHTQFVCSKRASLF